MPGFGTQPWSITKRTRRGQVVFQVLDLRTGAISEFPSKREATAQAKKIRQAWLTS